MGEFRVGRLVCPAIALVGAAVLYWAPWFVIKTTVFLPISIEMTIADITAEMIPTTLWFWASCIGLVIVAAAFLLEKETRRNVTRIGGVLTLSFPCRSIFLIVTDGENEGARINPGWGLIVALILGFVIIYLAGRIVEE